MNLANFICRRCIKTGSDKTPTGCASKLETVRRFGTVPTTLLPLYFRDDAYNLRLIERVTIEWEFFRWILHSALSILRGTRLSERTKGIVFVFTSILQHRGYFFFFIDPSDEEKCNIIIRERFKICVRKLSQHRAAHFYRTLAYHKKRINISSTDRPPSLFSTIRNIAFKVSRVRFWNQEVTKKKNIPCSNFQVIVMSTILCGDERYRWSANKTNIEPILQAFPIMNSRFFSIMRASLSRDFLSRDIIFLETLRNLVFDRL